MTKQEKLEELKQTRCAKCATSGNPEDMWCWNLQHCKCDVKKLRKEIEGECEEPIQLDVHIDSILKKKQKILIQKVERSIIICYIIYLNMLT